MSDLDEYIEILPYSEENLSYSLSNEFFSKAFIKRKSIHYRYLKRFLGAPVKGQHIALNAQTIIIERHYVSSSFVADYQAYYAGAHNPKYTKDCKRIHFFSAPLDRKLTSSLRKKQILRFFIQQFANVTQGKRSRKRKSKLPKNPFWDSYLGFIIVRPLPTCIIGPSIFSIPIKSRQRFPACRKYPVNLWGIRRKVYSLLFIEQDSTIGTCATAALFTAFNKLCEMFQIELPFQSEITLSAGPSKWKPNRIFPHTDGLNTEQIVKAIESIGLVAEVLPPLSMEIVKYNNNHTKAFLYAYCRIGIPVILGLTQEKNDDPINHAVTITGYLLPTERHIDISKFNNLVVHEIDASFKKTKIEHVQRDRFKNEEKSAYKNLVLKSYFIDEFYVHDDQVGPFSRLCFEDRDRITTENEDIDGNKIYWNADTIIAPLHKSINIDFEKVLKSISELNPWLHVLCTDWEDKIYWDIYLQFSNNYKQSLLEYEKYVEKFGSILFANLPKFIWVAECYVENSHVFDVILDSTEINYNFFALKVVFFNDSFKQAMTKSVRISRSKFRTYPEKLIPKKFLQIFVQELN